MTKASLRAGFTVLSLLIAAAALAAAPAFACTNNPAISAKPARAEAGAVVQVEGKSFDPHGSAISLYWGGASTGTLLATAQAGQTGDFSQAVTIPANAVEHGSYLVQATQQTATDQVTTTANLLFEIGPAPQGSQPAPVPPAPATQPAPGEAVSQPVPAQPTAPSLNSQPGPATQPAPAQPAQPAQPVAAVAPTKVTPVHADPTPVVPARVVQAPSVHTSSVPAQRPDVPTNRTKVHSAAVAPSVPRAAAPPASATQPLTAAVGPQPAVAPPAAPVPALAAPTVVQPLSSNQSALRGARSDDDTLSAGSGPAPWVLVPLALLGVTLFAGSTAAFIHELRVRRVRIKI